MQKLFSSKKNIHIYLAAIAGVGMAVIYLATSRYGPGVSGDSVRYLSVAQNLMAGIGFFDYSLAPLLAWPPLYPMVLAFLSLFTGDVFISGWILNVVLFGLTIYLYGCLIVAVVPNRFLYAYVSALLILVLPSLVRLYSIIAADPLFIVLCLFFFQYASFYLKSGGASNLVWMSVLTILASLVKYPGLVLAVTGSMVVAVFLFRSGRARTGLVYATGFLIVSILPLAGWVFFHNFLLYNSLFGARGYAEPFGNLYIAIEKLLHWFVPYSIIQSVTPYGLLVWIVASALILVQPTSWRRWLQRLFSAEILPVFLFANFYGLTLLFLVSYAEHKDFRTDRLHIVMIFSVLVFLVSALETLHLRWTVPLRSSLSSGLMVAFFLIWVLYPLNNTRKYIARSLIEGETDNNLYNTRALRESDMIYYLESKPFAPNEVLYSNHEGAAWFYTRHNIMAMPQGDRAKEKDQDVSKILEEYSSWPPEAGYIIWFDLDFKLHILNPNDLTPLAELTPIFQGDSGSIYRVIPN